MFWIKALIAASVGIDPRKLWRGWWSDADQKRAEAFDARRAA